MKKFMQQYLENVKQNRKKIIWQVTIIGGLYVAIDLIDRFYLTPKAIREVQELIDQYADTTE